MKALITTLTVLLISIEVFAYTSKPQQYFWDMPERKYGFFVADSGSRQLMIQLWNANHTAKPVGTLKQKGETRWKWT